jgi:hypothetical protein
MLAIKPDIKTTSTLEGEVIEMALDATPMGQAHLASIFSNMYSDPRRAVAREYMTNAWDAHLADGVTAPIQVTLPTTLDPMLRIQDFGRGLDREAIRNIYSKFGTSESRESAVATGTLGIGSKSALAYADSFIVVSVKNGKRIQVSVSKTAAMPTMTIMSETETDDPSGTTILIPTQRHDTFREQMAKLLQYWPEGSVLVDGKPPERFSADLVAEDILVEDEAGDIHIVESLHVIRDTTSYVVMGNVTYPIDREYLPSFGLSYGKSVLAFVPVGAVEFEPGRESLMYTKHTKDCLAYLHKAFTESIREAIQRDIDDAPTRASAVRAMIKWNNTMGTMPPGLHYQGADIPETLSIACKVVPFDSYKYSEHSDETRLLINTAVDAHYFTHYDKFNFTPTQKKKLMQFGEEQGFTTAYYVLLPSTLDATAQAWIDPTQMHKWEDVAAVRLPRNARNANGRIAGSYDCYVNGSFVWGLDANEIDQDNPVFFFEGHRNDADRWVKFLNLTQDDYTLAILSSNRVNKFERNFNCKDVRREAQEHAEAWEARQSKSDLRGIAIQQDWRTRGFAKLDPSKVDDPEVRKLARLARKDLTALIAQRKMYQSVARLTTLDAGGNPLDKYPLYSDGVFSRHADHIYLYLNAAYHAGKANDSK